MRKPANSFIEHPPINSNQIARRTIGTAFKVLNLRPALQSRTVAGDQWPLYPLDAEHTLRMLPTEEKRTVSFRARRKGLSRDTTKDSFAEHLSKKRIRHYQAVI